MRLHIVVEGQTEETFVRDILAPELGARGIFCDAHRITTGRRKGRNFRGGMLYYPHLQNDLNLWIKQDNAPDSWFTTMVDLYGIPEGFPGFEESSRKTDPFERVRLLESKLQEDIGYRRFIPYIQLHEFESLLFAEPESFAVAFPEIGPGLTALRAIRESVASPELINDGPDTCPSRRICQIVPQYSKTASGPLIVKQIGLPTLRRECHHFDEWLAVIESKAGSS